MNNILVYIMFSENEARNSRAEERLLEYFVKFNINEIENGTYWSEYRRPTPGTPNPKTISVKYNKVPPEEDFRFNF